MDFLTKLAWILLLVAPAAALMAQAVIDWIPARLQRTTVQALSVSLGVLLGVVALASFAGVRFVPLAANIWTLGAAYFAYCFLAFGIGRLPLRGMPRNVALILAALPIAFGYFLSTVGLLAIMFTVGAYATASKETRLATNLVCTRIEGGGPSGGYALHIHRQWPLLPVLHRQVKVIAAKNEYYGPPDCEALRGTKL
ncbi:hypothetical protein B7G68_14225 [Caulobacter segnis]|uniref:Uncharacterized protein n=2 Tax=Caulobacter segnis TaxID=88688 RepID=D5VL56_CAUST|nr:hypothetical protein [Caulobacter segnis]ADG11229.1 hypothetical protein Cseg_2781 [Caulobacter segnis ATCC 21756]AVQ02909.1 hypothetical protein B7G68_14225 [Caulobacter segnis]